MSDRYDEPKSIPNDPLTDASSGYKCVSPYVSVLAFIKDHNGSELNRRIKVYTESSWTASSSLASRNLRQIFTEEIHRTGTHT